MLALGLICLGVIKPDTPRFWPAATNAPGRSPDSFDKQFVRDYLETPDWDKKAPEPRLPQRSLEFALGLDSLVGGADFLGFLLRHTHH